jgi:hypothetical protein
VKIVDLLDREIPLTVNRKFALGIHRYRRGFILENKQHAEFFGGNVVGTKNVYFTTAYEDAFFVNYLNKEKRDIQRHFKEAPNIVPGRKITSDPMNLILFYLARKAWLDEKLSKKVRTQLARDLVLIFNYRTIAALHSKYFKKFLISEEVARAATDKLSNQYHLKRLGTWYRYMEYRTDRVFDPNGKELDRLLSGDDLAFLSVIVKAQGAIRSTLKLLYRNLDATIKSSSGGQSTSLISVIDGEETIGDVVADVPDRIRRTQDVFMRRAVYLKKDLIKAAYYFLNKADPEELTGLLRDLYRDTNTKRRKDLLSFIQDTLIYGYKNINENMTAEERKSTMNVLTYFKGIIVSSRSIDKELLSLRKRGDALIARHGRGKARQKLVRMRIGLMMYILILSIDTGK